MTNTEGMEIKFFVTKVEDAYRYLVSEEMGLLGALQAKIQAGRYRNGKPNNSTHLVINTDEHYADQVIDILKANGHWGDGDPAKTTKTISQLCIDANQNAINKGWYEEPTTFGEIIALLHSELSEALEDYRSGYGLKEIYYEGEKPCGIPIEFADVLIRIFNACGFFGIDLETAIKEKMAYNSTRPHKHGGKKI